MTGRDVGQLTIFSRPLSETEVGRKWPLYVKSLNCELKCPAFISEEMESGYMLYVLIQITDPGMTTAPTHCSLPLRIIYFNIISLLPPYHIYIGVRERRDPNKSIDWYLQLISIVTL